jgi:hypothetical protein
MWIICLAAFLMVSVCYPVLMMYDFAIDARLHEVGVQKVFVCSTKSMEEYGNHDTNLVTVNATEHKLEPEAVGRESFLLKCTIETCKRLHFVTEEPLPSTTNLTQ